MSFRMYFGRAEGECMPRRPNKDLPKAVQLFYSYFQLEMKTVFAKSRILKVKLKLKNLWMNIHFHFQYGMEWNDMEDGME